MDTHCSKAGAVPTIEDIAADALTTKYSDEGNNAGDSKFSLVKIAAMVNTGHGEFSTTNP
ncbi:hypothetical protein ACQKFM_25890 [Paenibacillus xylanexedens]|uniref:hypothetical protein n=1 Tax=Paenibacillus xylanexedens TaxID=528191 RepID=UPI003D078885